MFPFCLVFLPFCLAVCGCGSAYTSNGCKKTSPAPNGSTNTYSFHHQGYNRSYMVHIPSNWDQNSESGQPMMIGLHGYANTAQDFRSSFMMDEHADINTYLAVYFQATYFKDPDSDNYISSWNDGDCGASPGPNGPTCNPFTVVPVPRPKRCDDPDGNQCNWCNCLVNDVDAINELAKRIEEDYCIDMSREYITGFSQGGMLTHTAACQLSDRFAAAAPFRGVRHIGFDCTPLEHTTMPIFQTWGTYDDTVPGMTVASGDGWYYIPVSNIQEQFAMHNGCKLSNGFKSVKTVSDGIEGWTCVGWKEGCLNNATTVSCQWDGGHESPVNGDTNFGLEAAWQFLSQHRQIPPKTNCLK